MRATVKTEMVPRRTFDRLAACFNELVDVMNTSDQRQWEHQARLVGEILALRKALRLFGVSDEAIKKIREDAPPFAPWLKGGGR